LQMLEDTRVNVAPVQFQRIVIGVDPAGSTAEWADQTGIVVCALGHDSHLYVLEDASGQYTPSQWAQVCVDLYHRYRADRICVERNYGGDMVEATIRSTDPSVAIKPVTSSRGKVLRAEPVAALWEQKRAHVVGSMPALEDQACNFTHTWDRARDGSPDRLDGMIFAATELMSGAAPGSYFSQAAMLVGSEPIETPTCAAEVFATLVTTPRSGTAAAFMVFARPPSDHRQQLTVLDWAIEEVNQALQIEWLKSCYARVLELAKESHALSYDWPEILVERDDFGEAAYDLASVHFAMGGEDRRELVNLRRIEREVGKTIPSLDELASSVRSTVNGGSVKFCRCAWERQAVHRNASVNHATAQILSYLPEARAMPQELVAAFCSGVSWWKAISRGFSIA
jgi:hypothetical protein